MTRKKILLFIFSLLFVFWSYFSWVFDTISKTLYDGLMRQSLIYKEPRKDIIIIWVDKETIKSYGQYGSWSRSRYEWLLQEISKQAPKVVVFDYFFSEKTRPENVDWDLIERYSGLTKEATDALYDRYNGKINSARYISTIDRDFATLMREWNNIVLPYSFRLDEKKNLTNTIELEPYSIYKNVSHSGYVNISADTDGIVRSLRIWLNGQKSLAETVTELYLKKKILIPTSEILINYYAEPYNFSMIPFQNAYNGIWKDYEWRSINPKNSIILIWDTHESLWDVYKTPASNTRVMPGVEVLANEIQTLIEGNYIRQISSWRYFLFMFVLTSLIFVLSIKIRSLATSSLMALTIASIFVLTSIKLFALHIYIEIIPITLAILVPNMLVSIGNLVGSYREKERVRRIFSRYIDKSIVNEIVDSGIMPSLKGESKEVTVSFSDVEGFTTFSEKLDPKTLIDLLNSLFGIANTSILKNKWTIGKYIGDAIMAFWWAPIKHANHAILACDSALQIQQKLQELNRQNKEKNYPELHLKFWINTGIVTVGSIGSEDYADYTIIGDNVNLASRLEGINKYYHTYIIISESTNIQLSEDYITRHVDTIRVKGKETPIKIYELLGKWKDKKMLDLKKVHESGLKAYQKKAWFEALASFSQNDSLYHDPLASVFIERIQMFQKTPPRADWDGVWNFESK